MKAYTYTSSGLRAGIAIVDGHVLLGEEGRGRKLVRVPLPPGAVVEDGRLVEAPGPAGAALVLIEDQSGYRGSWRLTAPRPDSFWDGLAGQTVFGLPWHEAPAEATVIAAGQRAQGDAGGMGGGEEPLAVLRDGVTVEIHREGRTYDAPRFVRIACRSGEVIVTYPRREANERAAGAAWPTA